MAATDAAEDGGCCRNAGVRVSPCRPNTVHRGSMDATTTAAAAAAVVCDDDGGGGGGTAANGL